ncbi:MAG TPA: glycosyltransferase [Woeseiaceae bacterium]|nr:glycosyltransferase [Woeseiaceae bacterium]
MTDGRLLFVSTRFLFPIDSGGKIRTTQILRGLKGGSFQVTLVSPATEEAVERHSGDLESVCDEFRWWPQPRRGRLFHYTRMRHLTSRLPIPVRTDRHEEGLSVVTKALQESPDVAVFDFAHAAVLAPAALACPSVMFTHNVEAEIFRRHRDVAGNPLFRAIWSDQYRKMRAFEQSALERFDVVVAVAERDSAQFVADYGIRESFVIPTGVDLEFFAWRAPERKRDVVFCGSMDWMANQEGVAFFMDEVWDRISKAVPDAAMTVVGRAPPARMIDEARRRGLNWRFTGFVDDVRPFVQGSAVSVIPLRVGGGTRLKAYEAMAMGSPVVSTSIGMEGLPVVAGEHFLKADRPDELADAVVALLGDDARRERLSRAARSFVEANFSYEVAARAFETACRLAIERRTGCGGRRA